MVQTKTQQPSSILQDDRESKSKVTPHDAEDLQNLRQIARDILGDGAEDQEELLCELAFDELLDVLVELEMEKRSVQKATKPKRSTSKCDSKRQAAEKAAEAVPQLSPGPTPEDEPRNCAPAMLARTGVGARAFRKKTEGDGTLTSAEDADADSLMQRTSKPLVKLELAKDEDSDFEGITAVTRALLEEEVTKLCENVKAGLMSTNMDQGEVVAEEGVDLVEDERRRLADANSEASADNIMSLSEEQLKVVNYLEELELKNELHHKAMLYSLTKLEKVELFAQHELEAPKEGDFDIVKQLLSDYRTVENSRLRQSVRNLSRSRVKMRYVNNELVQTKDKYLLPTKDADFVRNTTCQLTLMGNSSKARREQRIQADDLGKKRGPVSNAKAPKKK